MGFKPSKYQQAIYNWIKTGTGNAVVEAVAGAGKTSTIVQAINYISDKLRACFLAFNKSIAEELKAKVPGNCDAMTLNGLGHRAWTRHIASVKLDATKTVKIINESLTEAEAKAYGHTIKRIIGLAKAYGIVPKGVKDAVGVIDDTDDNWMEIINHHEIDLGIDDLEDADAAEVKRMYLGLCRRVLSLSCEQKTIIDFDDQLYLTTIFRAPMPKYDWVFVDEAQDLNSIQLAMIGQMAKAGTRVVAIGDSRQAIYGFRGAGTDSMTKFALMFNATNLELSISYRCPKSHVELAKTIVPQIEAADNAIEGIVEDRGSRWKTSDFVNDDLVICRCNAPLLKLAYTLLADKVPVRILGKDIGAGLISLIKKMKARSVSHLADKLTAWRDRETQKMLDKDPDAATDKIDDKYNAIMIFVDMMPDATPDDICKEIENIYSDNTKGILTLATVHKAKGLEANRVYILDSWLLEMSRKRKSTKAWQAQQETNLRYVAYTRSKNELIFIKSRD